MHPIKTSICFLILCLLSSAAFAQDKPNVIVMMVDNLGWGELGVYGGGALRGAATPRLDALASEGMLLQNRGIIYEPHEHEDPLGFFRSIGPIGSTR